MAGTFIGVNPGDRKKDVVVSAATTGKKIEIFIESTVRQDQWQRATDLLEAVAKEQKVGA